MLTMGEDTNPIITKSSFILFHVNQVRNVAIREISKVSKILHWDDMHAD